MTSDLSFFLFTYKFYPSTENKCSKLANDERIIYDYLMIMQCHTFAEANRLLHRESGKANTNHI